MSNLKKPGMDNQSPGKYKEVGPRGGEVAKGDLLPPTQEKGRKWRKQ